MSFDDLLTFSLTRSKVNVSLKDLKFLTGTLNAVAGKRLNENTQFVVGRSCAQAH